MSIDLEFTIKTLIGDRTKLIGYVYAIVRDRHVAEDVFQEVVTLAVQKHGEINDLQHLLAWARKVAKNKSLEVLRQRGRAPIALEEDVLEMLEGSWSGLDGSPSELSSSAAETAMDSETEMDHLRDCLDRLTPRSKNLVHLKFVEGRSGAQIADAVGNEVHSVYVALTRAYRSLAECVRRKRLESDA